MSDQHDFYYTANPTSAHSLRTVEIEALGQKLTFTTDAGLFSRDGLDPGSRYMIEALPPLRGRVLDLGCGWGPVGCILKKCYPEIDLVMTDVNARAAETAKINLANNRLIGEVRQGDGMEHVDGYFHWILLNPPIRTGKANIYKMFADARERLLPEGHLVIVIRKQQGAPSALKFLQETYSSAEVIDKTAGYWTIDCVK